MKLEARGITVEGGGCHIVSNASLEISAGELVGLIGPNGAGKSTLLRALLGLQPRVGGTVLLDGAPFESFAPLERARRVAFLPQDRAVEWRLSVRDVIMLGRFPHRNGFAAPGAACEAAVDRALALVDCQTIADRDVTVLSGGERTRVLLARALAVEAPLLLVDEPITALDPYHQMHVMEILAGLARSGFGVLAVIHDLALAARFMDRIVLMSRGGVVASGPPAAVLDDAALDSVYHIAAMRGEKDGRPWMLPWRRTGQAETE